jgi:rod shape-determining protein MreD
MNSPLIKYAFRFVVLLLLQVLVLNKINLGGYVNPYIYLLFILLLPAAMNKGLVLILAFLTGITVDIFGNTPGLHTAATVFMAYSRPAILNLFFKNIEFTGTEEPIPAKVGLGGFFRYTLVMVFLHHLLLFMLEVLSLNNLLHTFYSILLSTMVTTALIMIIVMFFSKRKV